MKFLFSSLACGLLLAATSCYSAVFVVTNASDTGPGSLRQAIMQANNNPGPDTIEFRIQTGSATIRPLTALPIINSPLIIDATTQPGFAGIPLIELDGRGAGVNAIGLKITGGFSTIRGLIISGFDGDGVVLQGGRGNRIEGNFLGISADGFTARGNRLHGLRISASASNQIGGATLDVLNVISGNGKSGVVIDQHSRNNVIWGNLIGTDLKGMVAVPNGGAGIFVGDGISNRIGGGLEGMRNVIAGNTTDGIAMTTGATANRIQGNSIGLNRTGSEALPNSGYGVHIYDNSSSTRGNWVGGTQPCEGNLIGGNQMSGVKIEGSTFGNPVLGNSIFENANVAINLGTDGITRNDEKDSDAGPNLLQNFPVLDGVSPDGSAITISGRLPSTPNSQYRIEFFANDRCDDSGYGEGQYFLGATNVQTDAGGLAKFLARMPSPPSRFRYFSATATDPADNTSEFSRCLPLGGEGCVVQSTFDSDAEGWLLWTNEGVGTSAPNYTKSQGNPIGCLEFQEGGDGHTSFFQAPAKFLGNKEQAYGGYLDFDFSSRYAALPGRDIDILMIGAGSFLTAKFPVSPRSTWMPNRLFLDERAGWRKGTLSGQLATRDDILRVLGALEALRINAEFHYGAELVRLDNVRLVSMPPRLGVYSSGLASRVEWTTDCTDCFRLQMKREVCGLGETWHDVEITPSIQIGTNAVPMDTSLESSFYRLIKTEE